MITLTRLLARKLRAVLRRSLLLTSREFGPPVVFTTGPEGLVIRAWTNQAAVEYRQPGSLPTEQLAVPLELLADCEGTKEAPVTIEAAPKGRLLCQWQEKQVPLMTRYDAQKLPANEFPTPTSETTPLEPLLFAALEDAMQTADEFGVRYALHCVQLHGGRGQIAGTDGRQLLIQSGFPFPWSDDVLIPRTTVFGCRELPHEEPVLVGRSDNWISFSAGPWTVHLAIVKERRFPDLETYIRLQDDAVARLELSQTDAQFMAENLQLLPRDPSDEHQEVTIDLNGAVVVRSKSPEEPRTTQLVLSNSRRFGEQVVIHTDRRYLARALALGFRELRVLGSDKPLFCVDGRRRYAWTPLDSQGTDPPTGEPIEIYSPLEAQLPSHNIATRKPATRNPAMSKKKRSQHAECREDTTPSQNGQTPANASQMATGPDSSTSSSGADSPTTLTREPAEAFPSTDSGQPIADDGPGRGPIEQALALRDSLRGALERTNSLLQALRRQKKQQRLMQATLESIRQLQAVS